MNLRKKYTKEKKQFLKNPRRIQGNQKKRNKITDNLKIDKEKVVNRPRHIKNLVTEMMQLGKLSKEYETKINVLL